MFIQKLLGGGYKHFELIMEKHRFCNDLGINYESKILLSVGELNKNKNHEVVIRALALMNDASIKYLIAGKGVLRQKLETLCRDLKVENQVFFLGFRNDLEIIYKFADIFVFPSKREGLSVALLEACASGVPALVSNIRGNIDIIENGETGIVVNENKPEEYEKDIDLLLHNKKMYENFILKMKKKIEIYSEVNVKDRMRNIYNSLILLQ